MKYIINEHVYALFRGQLCNAVILDAWMREIPIGPAEAIYAVRIEYSSRNGKIKEIYEWEELEDRKLIRHPLWTGEIEVTAQINELAKVRYGSSSDREAQIKTIEGGISKALETIKRYGFVEEAIFKKLEELFSQTKKVTCNHYHQYTIKTKKIYANHHSPKHSAQRFIHARGVYQKRNCNWRVGNNYVNQRVRISVPRQLRHLTRGR